MPQPKGQQEETSLLLGRETSLVCLSSTPSLPYTQCYNKHTSVVFPEGPSGGPEGGGALYRGRVARVSTSHLFAPLCYADSATARTRCVISPRAYTPTRTYIYMFAGPLQGNTYFKHDVRGIYTHIYPIPSSVLLLGRHRTSRRSSPLELLRSQHFIDKNCVGVGG